MIDVDTTKHTGVDDETKVGADTAVERQGYESYRQYLASLDRRDKRHLWWQRGILATMLFNPEAHEFLKDLTPADFTDRGYYDWREPKGVLELLAEVVFAYWDQHGEPPRERIYDLISGLPEITFGVVKRWEHARRKQDAERARQHALYDSYTRRGLDFEDGSGRSEYVDLPTYQDYEREDRECMDGMRAVIEAYHRPVQPAQRHVLGSAPKRVSRAEKRKSRNQLAREMLRDRKPRKEIKEATGYTDARLSQLARDLETNREDETV